MCSSWSPISLIVFEGEFICPGKSIVLTTFSSAQTHEHTHTHACKNPPFCAIIEIAETEIKEHATMTMAMSTRTRTCEPEHAVKHTTNGNKSPDGQAALGQKKNDAHDQTRLWLTVIVERGSRPSHLSPVTCSEWKVPEVRIDDVEERCRLTFRLRAVRQTVNFARPRCIQFLYYSQLRAQTQTAEGCAVVRRALWC